MRCRLCSGGANDERRKQRNKGDNARRGCFSSNGSDSGKEGEREAEMQLKKGCEEGPRDARCLFHRRKAVKYKKRGHKTETVGPAALVSASQARCCCFRGSSFYI